MKKRILLISYGGGHVNMLLPIYRRLAQMPECEVQFLALTTARFRLEKEAIPFLTVKDFIQDPNEMIIGRQLLASLGESNLLPEDESAAYLGLSMRDLIDEKGPEVANDLFQKLGRHAFLPRQTMNRVFNKLKPDLVVTTNSPRMEKAAVLEARAMKIPCLVLTDMFNRDEFADRTSHPGYGDILCVLNQNVKNALVSMGRPAKEIVVTGNPAFDALLGPGAASAGKKLIGARGWENKKVLCFARLGSGELMNLQDDLQNLISEIVSRRADTVFAIRPHPNEKIESLNLPANSELAASDVPLTSLLYASTVVVTIMSTVGLEAALIGKPVIQAELHPTATRAPFVEMGLAYRGETLEKTKDLIAKALDGNLSPKVTSANAAEYASEKVVEQALSLLRMN